VRKGRIGAGQDLEVLGGRRAPKPCPRAAESTNDALRVRTEQGPPYEEKE